MAVSARQTRRMPSDDTATDAAKRTAALLRDARGVQRRLDKLLAAWQTPQLPPSDPSAKLAALSHTS